MIKKISQSFIKSMREYSSGELCGNIIKAKYIDGLQIDDQSEAMAEGSYFEFCLSGALPKNQVIPQPEYLANGKDLKMEYKRAKFNADFVRKLLKDEMGLDIMLVGRTVAKDGFEGTVDLVVSATRKIRFANGVIWEKDYTFIIDVKYSGLLNDKWNKHGWMFETNLQKKYHGTQAIQYSFVGEMDFYFLVVSNKNVEVLNEETGKKEFPQPEIKLLRVPIDEYMTEAHIEEGNKLLEQLKFEAEVGLSPRPSFAKCIDCPLFDTCEDRHTFPHVQDVDLTLY